MANDNLLWESLPAATDGAPDLWRTRVVDGWLVGNQHALTFVPDVANAWQTEKAPPSSSADAGDDSAARAADALRRARSDKVVATPAPGVATTEAEIEAFRIVEELCAMHDDAPDPSSLNYTDTQSFFVVHMGNPIAWALRIAFVAGTESWISFNLSADVARRLAPSGAEFMAKGFGGDVRLPCDTPDELRGFAPLILAALRAQAG